MRSCGTLQVKQGCFLILPPSLFVNTNQIPSPTVLMLNHVHPFIKNCFKSPVSFDTQNFVVEKRKDKRLTANFFFRPKLMKPLNTGADHPGSEVSWTVLWSSHGHVGFCLEGGRMMFPQSLVRIYIWFAMFSFSQVLSTWKYLLIFSKK